MSIRFAPFHMLVRSNAAVTAESSGVLHRKFVLRHLLSASRAASQDDLLNMFFASTRVHHPQGLLDLLTDEQTSFHLALDAVRLWRYPLDGSRVMQSRLAAQISYLKSLTDDSTVLFMDSDMLVNGSLKELDSDAYALALTVRDDAEMPLNGGFIAVSGARRREGIEVLERVMHVYQSTYSEQALWWGDQLALRDVVGALRTGQTEWTPGLYGPVKLLPSDVYNFSSVYGRVYADILRPRSSAKVLHFKGDRKRAMRYYWQAHSADGGAAAGSSRWRARAAIATHAIPEALRRMLRSFRLRLKGERSRTAESR